MSQTDATEVFRISSHFATGLRSETGVRTPELSTYWLRPRSNMAHYTCSVAMCTYQGKAFLSEQLESVLSQTVLPHEMVICDDGSTDRTLEIVERFVERAPFPVRVVRNPVNLKSTANFAQALSLCTGDLIVLSDQDDRWKPHKLERQLQEFQQQPELQMVFSDADLIDAEGKPIGHRLWPSVGFLPGQQSAVAQGRLFKVLLKKCVATGATMMLRRSLLDVVLPIPATWVHDAWITLMTATIGGRVALVSEPLIDYRQHAGQQIGAPQRNLWQLYRQAMKVSSLNGLQDQELQFEAAVKRAEELLGRTHPHVQALVRKVVHLKSRAQMHSSYLHRIGMGCREFVTLGYERYSLGWKSFLVDMLK